MGLFSGIKKFFKKVWSGITKVFEAVMKPVSKLLNSKLGKAIMLGITIFSLGSAFLAGKAAFTAGNGFIDKFVKGGQAFINDLLGTKFGEKAAEEAAKGGTSLTAQGAGEAAKQTMDNAADIVQGGVGNAIEGANQVVDKGAQTVNEMGKMLSQGGGMEQGAVDMTKTMAKGGGLGPTVAQSQSGVPLNMVKSAADQGGDGGGWLSKAATAAMDFAKSPTGNTVLGKTIEGVGNYYNLKDAQNFQDRIRQGFYNPNDPGYQALKNFDYSVDVPGNMGAGAMGQSLANFQRPLNLPPIRFEPQTGG